MTEHWNNKGRIIFSVVLIVFCSMLLALCYLLYPDKANSGPYLDSAHGKSYGVNRSSLSTFGYVTGNCVHCHEQHASIGGAEPNPTGGPDKYCLFSNNFNTSKTANPYAQSDSACFYCHIGTGTLQSPSFSNYSYSYTFGGCSITDCPASNIFDAFNGLSYHNLYDTYRFITGLSGSHSNFTNFPSDSNPCSGCHNIHIAQKSCGKPSGPFDTTKSAISKPSDHGNLWGDGAGEKMSDYTTGYQAPYWYGSTNYEPNNSSPSDPSILPDYVTFCTDCHNAANTIYSTKLGRNLYTINWNTEKHGKGAGVPVLVLPYTSGSNYVLSCTDCHEPHGSSNVYLTRKMVNKATVSVPTGGGFAIGGQEWASLCERCHGDTTAIANVHHSFSADCGLCHGSPLYKSCSICHYHGSTYTGFGPTF